MPAIEENLIIEQGATFVREYRWDSPTVAEPDEGNPSHWEPMDLSGYTAWMEIRKKHGGDLFLQLSSNPDPGGIELEPDGEKGLVRVTIGALQTADLSRSGVWDLELHKNDDPNYVVRLVQGAVEVSLEVTDV